MTPLTQDERDQLDDIGLARLDERIGTGDGAHHCEVVTATDG